jgi:palmitoyl-protein thioesterase
MNKCVPLAMLLLIQYRCINSHAQHLTDTEWTSTSSNGGSQGSSRSTVTSAQCHRDIEWKTHPVLCDVLLRLNTKSSSSTTSLNDPLSSSISSEDLYQFAKAMGWIVHLQTNHPYKNTRLPQQYSGSINQEDEMALNRQRQVMEDLQKLNIDSSNNIPVVIAHGMGDSCYNDGMIRLTKFVSQLLQDVYTICIPIGTSQSEDTNNGYFLNMNDSIDYFAQQIQQNDVLKQAGTFHAMGLSQGNNILRGYIARYNTIPVHTFISINGVNAGIGAVPHCIPEELVQKSHALSLLQQDLSSPMVLSDQVAFTLCDLLMEQASSAAYTTFAQKHSFQANYWRDPRPSEYDTYRTYSQLATLNNEVLDASQFNETIRINWSKTTKFVWIMAQDDRTVWPPQGEQWGAPDPNDPYHHIYTMNETTWYQQDYFGLRTAQEQHKNYFESFPGDHLQFTKEDLQRWVETYFVTTRAAVE